jgi:hypothetical protein
MIDGQLNINPVRFMTKDSKEQRIEFTEFGESFTVLAAAPKVQLFA